MKIQIWKKLNSLWPLHPVQALSLEMNDYGVRESVAESYLIAWTVRELLVLDK